MSEALKELFGKYTRKAHLTTGVVKEVNGTICNVERSELPDLIDVRLQAIEGDLDTHILITPKVDSQVTCATIDNEHAEAVVVKYSEIESIKVKIGDNECLINEDGVELCANNFGGLIKIDDLVDKLNQLENKVNDLIQKHNTHTHITTATVGPTPTVGTIVPTTATEAPIQPITQKSDLENDKVKHGG